MRSCYICKKETPLDGGYLNSKQNFLCQECFKMYTNLYIDDFCIEKGEARRKLPFNNKNSSEARMACVEYIYIILGKVSPRVFKQLDSYLKKGYTYLEIIRSLEFFYKVKKNSIEKSNGGIGIVPYVHKEAQVYYDNLNNRLFKLYKQQVVTENNNPILEVTITTKQKKEGFDINDI